MTDRLKDSLWFVIPFALVLVIVLVLRMEGPDRTNSQQWEHSLQVSASVALEGHALPTSGIFEAHSRVSVAEEGLVLPDTAVVIFLGGIGCSADQVKLLQYWSERHADTGFQNIPVLALYVDPLLGAERGAYEALILRRVSQAKFPFLVSQNTDFSLRAMGISTPQVALVENQVIARVFNPVIAPKLSELPQVVH